MTHILNTNEPQKVGTGPAPKQLASGTLETCVIRKAISIRAPWWWFILYGGKDIENRDWYTNYRGPVFLHASKWFNAGEVRDDFEDVRDYVLPEGIVIPAVTLNDLKSLGGHIVGQVDIVGCVQQDDSRWFQGKYGFRLRNPVAFDKPWPVKGALGFFDCGHKPDESQP